MITSIVNTQPPLVSVIIPAYNAEKFIERTLKSVLSQTYKNLEVLVVDDGSQDLTAEIIRAIAQQDRRVILLQQTNSGVAQARNLGIQQSKGEFIAPIDADDIWYSQNIEKQVECFLNSEPNVGLVYSWSVDIDEEDVPIGVFRAAKIEGDVYTTLMCHNFIGNASASTMRRSCLDKVGGYSTQMKEQNSGGCEDWDLQLRIAEHYQFRVIPEFLIGYRKINSSMSSDYTQMAKSHALMLQTVKERHPEIPAVLYRFSKSNLYIYFAYQANHFGDARTTLFWLHQALKSDFITPFLRSVLYKFFGKSILSVIISSAFSSEGKNNYFSFKYTAKTKAYDRTLTLEDINQKKVTIALKLLLGNLLHYFCSKLSKHDAESICKGSVSR